MRFASIGKNIRKYRKEKGFRQEDLAEKTALSANYIGMLERGEKLPSLETFISIANALEVSADMLLCDVVAKSNDIKSNMLYERMKTLSPQDKNKVYEMIKTFVDLSK